MIDYRVDEDGIATLAWNVADRPMNVLNAASILAFGEAVQRAIADAAVKGVIVTSSRPEFVAGGDLALLGAIKTAQESMATSGPISRILRDLERCGKPFVAAINGTALGGGFELCLACHRRIAADNPKAQFGLPEVSLGLLPAAGGTQRLPRMIGIQQALPFLTEGRKVAPAAALAAGLVDEVVPADQLLVRAKQWLLAEGPRSAIRPWDAKGFKFPGGTVQTPAVQQLFAAIGGGVLNKTQGLYPAIEAILASVHDGCQVDLDTGLKIEQRQFARLSTSATTKNMIRTLFYSIGAANALAERPRDVPSMRYSKIAVIGAGMMGAGLAYVAARAGLPVVLLDVSLDAAEKGKSYAAKSMDAQVAKGRLTAQARDQTLSLITASADFSTLKDCELVIEAVFESREVKVEVIRKAEQFLSDSAIFATNTSTLPISSLAEFSSRPQQYVGMHFFSPVERMPLVEVIRGKQTSDRTIALAMDLVKQLRMTPIIVNDCRSFYCNRAFALFPYEAMAMLDEGVNPILIENAARMAGMPMSPLALVDEFSIELMYKTLQAAKADLGESYVRQPQDPVLEKMIEQFDRVGKKSGRGFYDHPAGGKKQLWPGLAQHFPVADEQPDVDEVRKRMMYVQSVEAARCVAEGIVSARNADVGSILAWGFPAALGGAISQIDTIGAARFVAECDRLAALHGPRFAVPPQLREMAARGARYLDDIPS
ncbi:3-hydroxyacyl-CoA dehydrogenase NAD-binding domain-containing protein [Janthinobacterium sp. PC23-8]|uniref:3-hydroxyacyl-CoA dehydrogenase NAD-binding domain-containing protein n=1 Tax=Janthinobacterium sp. PC23-8 TaxID=2012679 RepID=UPI000B972A41|nr:3-hydroxyacyl-CoA dehydrogenase NAD-binding domain-containing protein [Janthinobacterium sp. PC23-8]OYO26318.1 3-hydroxyacyl-CoA dehydrogenase [Janthinobacterium sp. PC23-8]